MPKLCQLCQAQTHFLKIMEKVKFGGAREKSIHTSKTFIQLWCWNSRSVILDPVTAPPLKELDLKKI